MFAVQWVITGCAARCRWIAMEISSIPPNLATPTSQTACSCQTARNQLQLSLVSAVAVLGDEPVYLQQVLEPE